MFIFAVNLSCMVSFLISILLGLMYLIALVSLVKIFIKLLRK